MTAVRFDRRGDTTAITFVYDPAVVELLKVSIPNFVRSWNPTRREWLIFEPVYATQFAETLHNLGHTVIGIDDPSNTTQVSDWVRAVFQRVGPARASLAYRLLSRVCHPDHGGDHQLQIELNNAYAEISQRKDPAA